MDKVSKRNACNSEKLACCSDARRNCFGKRHDAFFCYNDEKAHQGCCPSMWHPRNPTQIKIVPNFRKCDNRKNCSHAYKAEPYRADPYRAEPYRAEPYRAEPYRAEPYKVSYRSEPSRRESYRAEPYRTAPSRIETYRNEPCKERYIREMEACCDQERSAKPQEREPSIRCFQVELCDPEPGKTELYRLQPCRIEHCRAEHCRTEPSRVESHRAEPYQFEAYKADPGRIESFDSIPRRGVTVNDGPGCYCGRGTMSGSGPRKAKKTPGLKAAKEYLKKCLLQRLTLGWTEEDDLNLSECIFNHLSKIKGSNQVIPILDEISSGKRLDPVLRTWINQLKRIYARPRGEDNLKANLYSKKRIQSNEESFNGISNSIREKQYHLTGGSEKYNNLLKCKPQIAGKLPEMPIYKLGEREKFYHLSNYNSAMKEAFSEHKTQLDTMTSDYSTQSDKMDNIFNAYNVGYHMNGCNEIAYNSNNGRKIKNETFEKGYKSCDQPLRVENDERPCCSRHCT